MNKAASNPKKISIRTKFPNHRNRPQPNENLGTLQTPSQTNQFYTFASFLKLGLLTLTIASVLTCPMLTAAQGLTNQAETQEDENTAHKSSPSVIAKPHLYPPLTEPPCSYCVNQNLKNLVLPSDPVLAWIRGAHNGGAMPLRHFIAGSRVVNDTYGLFFYDADGGYVSAFEKDYGYQFYGWRGGVMVVRSKDGSLFSALTGIAFDGPQKGEKLNRVPNITTNWSHWLMLHPESTAYDLFDGETYKVTELPTRISAEALNSIGTVDARLEKFTNVLGIEGKSEQLAVALPVQSARACQMVNVDNQSIALFWYGPTKTAVAFLGELDGQTLTFYADEISPETAPFKDRQTGSRWTLAGRAVDGPLRGKELTWAPSLQCKWYAWSHEYPQSKVQQHDQ